MTREVRYLMFSEEELYLALTEALRVQGKKIPKGTLKRIHVGTTAKPDIALHYINNKGAETISDQGAEIVIPFEDQDVMSALLLYCRQHNIPMSAKATKTIEIKDGTVGMFCTLNFKVTTMTSQDDKISYGDKQANGMKEMAKTLTAMSSTTDTARPATPAKSGATTASNADTLATRRSLNKPLA